MHRLLYSKLARSFVLNFLAPVPRWPPPSTCSQPGLLWLLCQASAASPEWAASDLLWFLFVSFGPASPRAPGRRPARCSSMASVHLPLAAAPHLSLLLSPRCQLGGNWHGRSPASFLQLGVATLLFFLYFKHTHILTHAHTHTKPPRRPRQHASLLSGAAPAKKAQKRAAAESRAAER